MIPAAELLAATDLSDEVRSIVQGFVREALDEALHQLREGTPEIKTRLFTTLMPLLTKQLETQKENDQLAEMRIIVDGYMADLRAAILPADVDLSEAVLATLPEDHPEEKKPAVKKSPAKSSTRSRARKKPPVTQ